LAYVRYEIGTKGRVTQCKVVQSSGWQSLDALSCDLVIARFQFRPAIDAGGKSMAEIRTQRVRWGLETARISREVTRQESVRYVADAYGNIHNCQWLDSDADRTTAPDCPAKIIPFRDKVGNPVARRVTVMRSVIVTQLPDRGQAGGED
jgi:hypothetical protein